MLHTTQVHAQMQRQRQHGEDASDSDSCADTTLANNNATTPCSDGYVAPRITVHRVVHVHEP